MSNDTAGIGIGIKPGSVFAHRTTFNGVSSMLTISMEFALTPLSRIPSSAWFEFSIFKLDHPTAQSPFRAALEKYCKKVYADPYMERVIRDQGIWMPFDKVSSVEGWEDFGFKFYEGSADLKFNTNNSIYNYPYIEPPVLHHNFYDEDPAAMLEKIRACNTTECKATASSYTINKDGTLRYFKESAAWNVGTIMPLNTNPNIPGDINACKNMLNKVDSIYKYENNVTKLAGIYVDSLENNGYTFDYRSEYFKYLGATPIYDNSKTPCAPIGAWTFDFMGALAQKLRSEKGENTTIMGNSVYAYFSHMAQYVDVAGIETHWMSGETYKPLDHNTLFFYRMSSFQKPYLFLQNSNFNFWTYEMTDKYMQKSLLYGIWPGFFSADAFNDRYFNTPALYNRDRPLFKKYIPVLRTITSQGWEPVTCTVAIRTDGNNDTNTALYMERWGGSSVFPMYFTMRMESTIHQTVRYNVSIDFGCLRVENDLPNKTLDVTEVCQKNAAVKKSPEGRSFEFDFENETTYVFKIDGDFTIAEESEIWATSDSSNNSNTCATRSIFDLLTLLFALMLGLF